MLVVYNERVLLSRRQALALAPALTLLSCAGDQNKTISAITKQSWGNLPTGESIDLYTLRNDKGVEATITNYGGKIVTLKVPDRAGNVEDIALGYDSLAPYCRQESVLWHAGRAVREPHCERAVHARWQDLYAAQNNGPNSLHGGAKGFDKVVWAASIMGPECN